MVATLAEVVTLLAPSPSIAKQGTAQTSATRPAREIVLSRLLEVLFIEALRSERRADATPGLLRGMADPQLAPVLRRIHEDPARSLSAGELARDAAMSRSTFYARFQREIGVTLMDYATGWRMAQAKGLLRRKMATAEIAERVGYGSGQRLQHGFQPPCRREPRCIRESERDRRRGDGLSRLNVTRFIHTPRIGQ